MKPLTMQHSKKYRGGVRLFLRQKLLREDPRSRPDIGDNLARAYSQLIVKEIENVSGIVRSKFHVVVDAIGKSFGRIVLKARHGKSVTGKSPTGNSMTGRVNKKWEPGKFLLTHFIKMSLLKVLAWGTQGWGVFF